MTFILAARYRAPRALALTACIGFTLLTLAAATAPAWAQPLIYPAKGQSAQQQDRDRYECHDWARTQSGYDPSQPAAVAMAAASAPTTAPTSAGKPAGAGTTASGMATGAMGAAAVAELTHHDAGRAAAIGALGGGLAQRVRQQQQQAAQSQQAGAQQQQQAQAALQQQAARQQQRSTYERAVAACMEGRGYTVK
jgi:hypothetical protein